MADKKSNSLEAREKDAWKTFSKRLELVAEAMATNLDVADTKIACQKVEEGLNALLPLFRQRAILEFPEAKK